jgi:hypothetical protein
VLVPIEFTRHDALDRITRLDEERTMIVDAGRHT